MSLFALTPSFPLQEDAGMREDTYELCYNAACLLLGKGLYEEAEGKLKRAEGG